MKRPWTQGIGLGVVIAVVALSACKKQASDAPAGPPQPVPAQVFATASVRSGTKVVAGTRAFIDAIKPGTGAILSDGQALAILATIVGVPSLDGVDLAGPLHLLGADDGQARGAVLVARPLGQGPKERSERGASLVIQGGWVVVGPHVLVELVRGYAISTLVTAPAPEALTVRVDLPKVLVRYRDQLAAARAQLDAGIPGMPGGGKLMASYLDGTLALAADVDQAVIEVAPDGARASMSIALVPRAGTRLARFVAAQAPADQTLLARLPADDQASVVAVGRFALGPYREATLALIADMLGVTGQDQALVAPFAALMTSSTGELAATMSLAGGHVSLVELFALTDEATAKQAIATGLAALGAGRSFETMGIKTTVRATPRIGEHDGVVLGSYATEVDTSSLPPAQAQAMSTQPPAVIGVFDRLGLITMTDEGVAAAARAIDAARGKAPTFRPTPAQQALLAESLARKESMVMLMDLARMMAGVPGGATLPFRLGFGFALGFADGNATLRVFVTPGG